VSGSCQQEMRVVDVWIQVFKDVGLGLCEW
jgi:hypothetical protein